MRLARQLLVALPLSLLPLLAAALEMRSIEPVDGAAVTILYDAPSKMGKKLFLIRRYTPVEVVVGLEGWVKVRDVDGALAWVEKKALAERRTVLVTADRAQIRQTAADSAALAFEAEKGVALELLEPAVAGWAKVRHRDGSVGYLRVNQVWGL
jgi:SH3-like domain-containing protein